MNADSFNFVNDFIIPSITLDKVITMVGVIIAVVTLRKNHKLAKINFSIDLTNSHRDVWVKAVEDDELSELKMSDPNFSTISDKQKRHVNFILLNSNLAWQGYKQGLYNYDKGARIDTGDFFNLPIPSNVWGDSKKYHEKGFVKFIEKCRKEAKKKTLPIIPLKTKLSVFVNKVANSKKGILKRLNTIASYFSKFSWWKNNTDIS